MDFDWLTILVGIIACMGCYWIVVPTKYKTPFLVLCSAGSLAWINFTSLLLPIAALMVYAGLRFRPKSWLIFLLALTVPVSYLLFFKYFIQIAQLYAPDSEIFLSIIVLPLGTSYITFKLIHYIIEFRGERLPEHTFLDFILYLIFTPIFFAGPIELFPDFIEKRTLNFDGALVIEGLSRIATGIFKKVIIVSTVLASNRPDIGELAHLPYLWVWCFLIMSFLIVYFDFSAYSDLAVGISLLFGFRVAENFNYPLASQSIQEFWQKWHISLSNWAQRYVYFPTVGLTRNTGLALVLAMVFIGLWHEGTGNRLLWGLYHGLGLLIYARFLKQNLTLKRSKIFNSRFFVPVKMASVLIFVSFSYVFVETTSINQAFSIAWRVLSITGGTASE